MDTIKRSPGRAKVKSESNPFRLIREIRDRIRVSNESHAHEAGKAPIKYLWLHVTSDGIEGSNGHLSTEEWLNIVDEAGALGVQWVVVGWEAVPEKGSDVWRICQWAQETHGCHVGVHILGGSLGPQDIEALLKLNPERTHVFVARTLIDHMRYLEKCGIRVHEADVSVDHRTGTCTLPDDMVCVGPEGKLYTCGLVLGDDRFCLGNVFDRAFSKVVTDQSLPHHVPDSICREGNHHSCDACPPLMVQRTIQGK